MTTVSFKLPAADLKRIPAKNRDKFLRAAVREKLERQEGRWKPKTAFGRKLLALSNKYKGKRLDAAAITDEIRQRRGGFS